MSEDRESIMSEDKKKKMNIVREYSLKIGVIGSHDKFKKEFVRSFAEKN